MRGRERFDVAAVLAVSAAASGALVGFAAGILAIPAGLGSMAVVSGLVLAGGVADLVRLSTGRPHPIALRSQVPMEWGKLFSPRLVAMLYGLRLGVGPLTMLSTWLWWSAFVASALISPAAGALSGAVFGLSRVASMGAVMGRRLSGLRSITRPSWLAVDVGALVGVGALVLIAAGCVRSGEVTLEPVGEEQTTVTREDEAVPDQDEPVTPTTATAAATPETVPATVEPGDIAEPQPEQLEAGPASSPDELAATVIPDVALFNRLDGPGADEFLDLEAAANRQPDPTEERPLLETRRFQGGWTRAFRNDTQDVVIAQVYEFETAAAASFYLEDGLITLGGFGVEFFDLADMEGVRGFKQDSVDEVGPIVSYGLTFTADRRWYLLTLTGDPATATLDILVAATRAQIELAS